MKRQLALVLVLAAASLLVPSSAALAQPAPVTVFEKRFQATPPSGPYDELLLVLDLAPGTTYPAHSHGGPVFITVVEGALWERSGGHESSLNAGDTLMEEVGRVHEAGNNGPGTTRLLITVLLPKGADLTTDVQTGAAQA